MNRKRTFHTASFIAVAIAFLPFLAPGVVLAYPWPVGLEPWQQYPVSSTLDECRAGPPRHLHDGIDITGPDADTGSPVYAVDSGTAELIVDPNPANNGVRVGRYAYVHVNAEVDNWQFVQAEQRIGTVNSQNHLHFTDGYDQMEVNPLEWGHLEPFDDTANPTIHQVKFYPNGVTSPGYEMNPFHLSGAVDIVVRCSDEITGGGSNAGVYTVGYEVFDGSGANMVSVRGPVYNLYFDYWWWNNYLPYIYTDQSSTTVYYYIATNGLGYDSWLDVSTLPNVVGPYNDGYYTIKVYAGDIDQGFAEHAVDVRVPELGANEVTMTIQNKFRRPLGPDLDGGVVEVNDTQYPSPFPMICSPGQTVELTAVSPQTINGKRYIFNYWNDGYDEPTRVVQASESTYTAYFSTRAHTKPADNDDVDVTASIPQTPDPTVFSLSDGAPNPFGTETTISYSLEKCAPTTIRLYDSSWQLVRVLVDENRSAGRHTVCWDGRDEQGRATPSGVYFCRMEAGSFSATSRLVLVR